MTIASGTVDSPDRAREERPTPSIDPAALGMAVVAAVLTVTLAPGKYVPTDSGTGLVLASLLAAYYRPSLTPPVTFRDRSLRAFAFGAIGGLVTAMVASWPIQDFVTGWPTECLPDGVARISDVDVSNLDGHARMAEIGDCAGDAALAPIGLTWLVSGVVLAVLHFVRVPPAGR